MQKVSVNLLEAFQADFTPDFEFESYENISLSSEQSKKSLELKVSCEASFQIGNIF